MNYLRKFNESSNLDLISKYLGILEDVFTDFEDTYDINLNIIHYEYDTNHPHNYKTTNIDLSNGTFNTTAQYIYGYFSVSKLVDDKNKYIDEFFNYISKATKYFDHEIELEWPSKGYKRYLGALIILKEPMV